ncbi:MAG TPA: hypothetical protein VNB06_01305 [Thermoanaerobaculia bacterium]|nr:hypothetical protein [Thermoanaerobaculia bacterium]
MSRAARSIDREPELAGLPGADLVAPGLVDRRRGRESPEAALVEVAHGRLRALGLAEALPPPQPLPELRLYERLGQKYPGRDPYPIYCAWLEQLDSFLWAMYAVRRRAG